MVVSYWDTAASLVLNGGIDQKMFLDANTEHIFVYAKIAEFLPEVRQLFREPDFLIHLENLCLSMPIQATQVAIPITSVLQMAVCGKRRTAVPPGYCR